MGNPTPINPTRVLERLMYIINDSLSIPKDEEMIIPTWLLDERSTVLLYLPNARENEEYTKSFISRIYKFTNNKFNIKIIWQTRKIRSLFKLKDKVKHISVVIYKGTCNCIEEYCGVTDRIAEIR